MKGGGTLTTRETTLSSKRWVFDTVEDLSHEVPVVFVN